MIKIRAINLGLLSKCLVTGTLLTAGVMAGAVTVTDYGPTFKPWGRQGSLGISVGLDGLIYSEPSSHNGNLLFSNTSGQQGELAAGLGLYELPIGGMKYVDGTAAQQITGIRQLDRARNWTTIASTSAVALRFDDVWLEDGPDGLIWKIACELPPYGSTAFPKLVVTRIDKRGVQQSQVVSTATADNFNCTGRSTLSVAVGPDNAVWIATSSRVGAVGSGITYAKLAYDGSVALTRSYNNVPQFYGTALVAGFDGYLYLYSPRSEQTFLVRIDRNGDATDLALPEPNFGSMQVGVGADGRLWLYGVGADRGNESYPALTVYRSNSSGGYSKVLNAPRVSRPQIGPDGRMWSTQPINYNLPVEGTNLIAIGDLGIAAETNDQFANRRTLTAPIGTASAVNLLASAEAGEPDHLPSPGRKSLWWTFTPQANGQLQLSTKSSPVPAGASVYSGSSLGALSLLGSVPLGGSAAIQVSAGVPYQLALDSSSNFPGPLMLNYVFRPD